MAESDDARHQAADDPLQKIQGRSGPPDPHRVRGVRPPPGWVPELGLFFPPSGAVPAGFYWRLAVGIVLGVIAGVIVGGPVGVPDPWPFVAAIVPLEAGLVWGFIHMGLVAEREKARRAELFGPLPPRAKPVSPFSAHARRVAALAVVACLLVGAVVGAALAADGHARLGVLVGVASVLVAVIAFTASAWSSLRSSGPKT
jgi:hypothetical protein